MKRTAILLCALLIFPFALMSQTPTESDISYGPLESEKLDYWAADQDNSPIVLMVTAEDWSSGSKDQQQWVDAARLFHQNGYAVVVIDQVLSSDAAYQGFPQQPANLSCAIGWTKENAALLKGNPDKLILMGTSAGAHLAALHALNPVSSEENSCDYSGDRNIIAVMALSGVYDYDVVPSGSKTRRSIAHMLRDSTAYWKVSQPIEADLTGQPAVDFLLLHGTRDVFAGNHQPIVFHRFLTKNGYPVSMDILEDRKHDLLADLADPESWVAERVIGYANSVSGLEEEKPTALLPSGDLARVRVYPNPTERDLYISLEPASYRFAELILTALDGREVLHTNKQYTEQIKLDIHHFPRGTYILSILTDRDKHQRKIVIN